MKKIYLLSLLMLVITACSKDETEIKTEDLQGSATFSTRGGDATDGVSVLIFSEQATGNYYEETFSPKWDKNGQAIKILRLKKEYQFLFYKWANEGGVTMTPSPLDKDDLRKIEDIRFNAKANDSRTGYVLPVDTVWLPKDSIAEPYTFTETNGRLVSEALEMAVSQIEVKLLRGYKKAGAEGYDTLKYESGRSILEAYDKITLDVKKVGTSVGLKGNYVSDGPKGTYVAGISGIPLEGDMGFAFFNGPLVFPNENMDDESEIDITLTPNSRAGNPYKEKKVTVKGKLQRGMKLDITLWMSVTYEAITIEVSIDPIIAEESGNGGIWD